MSIDTTVGGASADSYGSLADFETYCTALGKTIASGTSDASKEVALRNGTVYLDRTYQDRWAGYRTNETQVLAWPRRSYPGDSYYTSGGTFYTGIRDCDGFEVASDAIPKRIRDACFEAAYLSLTGTVLLPVLVRGGQVQSESVAAGPVSTDTTYAANAPTQDQRLAIEGLLRGLIVGGPGRGSTGRIVRG